MCLVVDTPDLPTLQRHATDLGLERGLKARITRMQRSKAWGDLGDLKRELLDLWTEERNTLAKSGSSEGRHDEPTVHVVRDRIRAATQRRQRSTVLLEVLPREFQHRVPNLGRSGVPGRARFDLRT